MSLRQETSQKFHNTVWNIGCMITKVCPMTMLNIPHDSLGIEEVLPAIAHAFIHFPSKSKSQK